MHSDLLGCQLHWHCWMMVVISTNDVIRSAIPLSMVQGRLTAAPLFLFSEKDPHTTS
jgi:hypothetical protein